MTHLLQTLRDCIVVGYYPYEGIFPTERLYVIASSPNDRAYRDLFNWWNETTNELDQALSERVPRVYGRSNDNKVCLKLITKSDNVFYLTFYDNDFIVHLSTQARNREASKMICV